MSFIELRNITKIYDEGSAAEVKALKDVNIQINAGENISVIGKSGSGKSTLLHILGCLDVSTSGEYYLDGISINGLNKNDKAKIRNQRIGFVLQQFGLILNRGVIDNISVPLYFSVTKIRDIRNKVLEICDLLHIEHLVNKKVFELSGGEKQRVAIGRALINSPDIILADEPTGALDTNTSSEVMEIFKQLNIQGKTIIVVTHDKEIASKSTRIIEISDGKILREG